MQQQVTTPKPGGRHRRDRHAAPSRTEALIAFIRKVFANLAKHLS